MYATCLFCNAPFEKNESLEAFPVGRRLAFDAAKGRLWVVCKKCERWSLSPLDERWEAIEQAERLYRDTRKRVSTDNIGLAKVSEGTTLIRIGEPLRPEFAAWRYGDQFGRRRRRQILLTGTGLAAGGALIAGVAAAGISIGGLWWVLLGDGNKKWFSGNPDTIVARLHDSRGRLIEVRRRHLAESMISRASNGSMVLRLRFKGEKMGLLAGEGTEFTRFEGAEAQRVAAILLPKVNRFGGNRRHVADAVGLIEAAGSAEAFVDEVGSTASTYTAPREKKKRFWTFESGVGMDEGLFALPAPQRLALEMALHEESERRALEGELATLEKAWRDAEEIAGISDNLTVPDSVSSALDEMKKR